MIGWATAHNNQLPAYGYWINTGTVASPVPAPQRSWVVELLPYMDQQAVFDRWIKTDTLAVNDGTNLDQSYSFAVLACPNDDSAFQVAGGLSYVVNAGFADGPGTGDAESAPAGGATPDAPDDGTDHSSFTEALDWDGDGTAGNAGDWPITKATGVFWPEWDDMGSGASPRPSSNLGRIYDGTSNTIMMGENYLAGKDIVNTTIGNTWASPEHRNCTFVAPVTLPAPAAGPPIVPNLDIDEGGYTPDAGIFPNDSKTNPIEGESPYLNSFHPGIVVVGFCDGTVRTLNESIDEGVYLRLMTPNGTRLRSSMLAEKPLSDTDF